MEKSLYVFKVLILVYTINVPTIQTPQSNNSDFMCMEISGISSNSEDQLQISSLKLSECYLTSITKDDFSHFSNVINFTIVNSYLYFPPKEQLFSPIENLKILQIVASGVTEEIFETFAENKNIQKLNLTANNISLIRSNYFTNFIKIEEIDLSNNLIEYIEEGSFRGLTSLTKLNLKRNKIGVTFEPNFLSQESSLCAVCRTNIEPNVCSKDEKVHCRVNSHIDQLWWMGYAVNIQLHDNPICSIVAGKNETAVLKVNILNISKTHQIQINTSEGFRTSGLLSQRCRVYENGYCYKHESRRMFLLEVCGGENVLPSQILQRNPGFVIQNSPPRNQSQIQENMDLETMLLSAGFPTLFFVGLGIVLFGAAIGSVLTLYEITKYERKKLHPPNSAGKNTTTRIAIENFPLYDNKHTDKDENSVDSRLHEAIIKNNLKKVKHLLASGVNPNVKDPNGELPILYAARVGNEKIIQELRNHAANINALNSNGQAAIHSAVGRGNLSTVQCLFYNKANINIKNRDGNPPLSLAVKDGHFDIAAFLISKGANVNERNNFQQLPIHFAAKNGHTSVLKLLISKGSEYGPYDDRGYTPLHNAARKGYVDIANILLKAGENVDVRNSSRNTPLHKAAKGGQMKMIEFLLENDADVQAINMKGHMPHTIARFMEHEDCERLLKQRLHEILNQGSTHREAGNM